MAEDRIETLRRIYDGWQRGDFSGGAEHFTEDAVLAIDPEIPDPGEHVGLDGIRRYMTGFLSAWEDLTIRPRSFTEAGDDKVLVRVDQRGTGRGSGAPAALDYFHLWTFRGEKVLRLDSILREATAREAAGLAKAD